MNTTASASVLTVDAAPAAAWGYLETLTGTPINHKHSAVLANMRSIPESGIVIMN